MATRVYFLHHCRISSHNAADLAKMLEIFLLKISEKVKSPSQIPRISISAKQFVHAWIPDP